MPLRLHLKLVSPLHYRCGETAALETYSGHNRGFSAGLNLLAGINVQNATPRRYALYPIAGVAARFSSGAVSSSRDTALHLAPNANVLGRSDCAHGAGLADGIWGNRTRNSASLGKS